MEKVLSQLVDKLRKAYGDRLVSVVLYGSAAAGDYHSRFSDLNTLCVLSQVTPSELRAAEEVFRWWRGHGNPAPLLVTEQELAASTDCFPIEFHDIRQNHRLLHGKDVVMALEIGRAFYRAQVEHELRAKLLRLRQKAAGLLSDHDLLRRLMADSISTFCVLFRHALVLHGVDAPAAKRQVIQLAGSHFGVDPLPFEQLLGVREERIRPREIEPIPLFESLLAGISKVIDAVDKLGEGAHDSAG